MLQFMESQRVGHDLATEHTHNYSKFNSVSLQEDSLTCLLCVLCAGWYGEHSLYTVLTIYKCFSFIYIHIYPSLMDFAFYVIFGKAFSTTKL